MKNILHTNLPAVRHERGRARGDSCSLNLDQLTANDTPTPASHPTKINTTAAALVATEDIFVVMTMNERIFFMRPINKTTSGKEATVSRTTST